MAENLVVNNVTYNGVDSVAFKTSTGETATFYLGEPIPVVGIDEDGKTHNWTMYGEIK